MLWKLYEGGNGIGGGGGYTTDTNQYTNACVVLPNMERDAGQSDILDKVLKCEISINKAVHREKDVVILWENVGF